MTFNMRMDPKKLVLILSASLAALTSACSTPQSSRGPVTNWSNIQVAETVERLELYARPDGLSLSARDETAVAQFLQEYGRSGDGPLYINMPSQTMSQGGAVQSQALIKTIMGNIGLAGAPIQSGSYQTAAGSPAPVVVSYRRLKTVPQDCRFEGNVLYTGDNQPYSSFGCSFHANLAAMIGDPRQLLEPYQTTPPDMQRRMQVYDKYIKGENPASAQPDRQEISASE